MWSADDWNAFVNVFCCVLGIGSLGMAGKFALAGPIFASIGLLILAGFNIYASCVLSKCLLECPPKVQTFADLGEYTLGAFGRWTTIFLQFGTCLLIPAVFLVLGGQLLLPGIFAVQMSVNVWIIIMAGFLLPIVLIPTLKEAVWASFAGALTALVADGIALTTYAITEEWDAAPTNVEVENVFKVFGGFALGYGAAVVIPAVQRDHDDPQRLPQVIFWTLASITVVYFVIGLVGFAIFGCNAPSNLLWAMEAQSPPQFFAYFSMEIGLAVSFAVILNPALFVFERYLGFHKAPMGGKYHDEEAGYDASNTPGQKTSTRRSSVFENRSLISSLSGIALAKDEEVTTTAGGRMKSIILRTVVVAIQTFIACALQNAFTDFADFVGATSITGCCMILPCMFYWKIFNDRMPAWEKGFIVIICVVSLGFGLYSAYNSLLVIIEGFENYNLFEPADTGSGGGDSTLCKEE